MDRRTIGLKGVPSRPIRRRHRRCGCCGRIVAPRDGNRKADGWIWHYACWRRFLLS